MLYNIQYSFSLQLLLTFADGLLLGHILYRSLYGQVHLDEF
jgi:hypothetical protein